MTNQTHPDLPKAASNGSPGAWSTADMTGKLPDFIRFGRAVCGDLGQAESLALDSGIPCRNDSTDPGERLRSLQIPP